MKIRKAPRGAWTTVGALLPGDCFREKNGDVWMRTLPSVSSLNTVKLINGETASWGDATDVERVDVIGEVRAWTQ